jgi:hypothetical protein
VITIPHRYGEYIRRGGLRPPFSQFIPTGIGNTIRFISILKKWPAHPPRVWGTD